MTKVQLFVPCYIQELQVNIATQTTKLLQKLNCEVILVPSHTCCGQVFLNMGHYEEATKLAAKYITDFDWKIPVVLPSPSCTGMICSHYPSLLPNESKEAVAQTFDLIDFMVNNLDYRKLPIAPLQGKLLYHQSCSSLRELKQKQNIEKLLTASKLTWEKNPSCEECCGFGGMFSMKFSSISVAMAEQKVEQWVALGIDIVVSADYSCVLHLESYAKKQNHPIQFLHISDIYAV